VEEESVKLKNYDIVTLDKVKEAEINKKAVFSAVEVETSPKLHYLKTCIEEKDLALPLLDKVCGKTLCL
jgi:hypothetical protein